MRVQAVCGADLSDWSSWRGFTVPQRSSGDLDKDAYYLFFIDGVKNTDSNGDIGGYMNLKFKKI